jgi:hypothetical protein
VTCRFTEIQHVLPGRDDWQGPALTMMRAELDVMNDAASLTIK